MTPEQTPVSTQQAPVTTQQAPTNIQQAPPNTQSAPSIAPPAPTSAPLTPDEKTELRKELTRLEATLETVKDKTVAPKLRKACYAIKGALDAQTVSPTRWQEVNEAIDAAWAALPKPHKQRSSNTQGPASSQSADDRPDTLPVDVLIGGAMGDRSRWPYLDVVLREMTTMARGGVGLRRGRLEIALGVAHWQPAKGDQHYIKVCIDEAEVGKGTKMRAYVRYRVVDGRLVLELVAIREEHSGVEKTLVGDEDELIDDDGN